MEIGSQKPEIPERFGDIKKKTDTLSKLSVLVRRGRVLSYASVTAYGDPLTISKITLCEPVRASGLRGLELPCRWPGTRKPG